MKEGEDFSFLIRLAEARKAAFGDDTALFSCTFEADCGVPAMEQARKYAARWKELSRRGLGLLFWGKPGTGKTFAAACVANELCAEDVSVRMCTPGRILNRLPCLSPQEKEDFLADLHSCGLLILDDLGMERRTDYAKEQLFTVIDGRCRAGKPMLVTTNLPLSVFKSAEDLAEKRIFDRLLERCVPVLFDGESLRHEKAKENLRYFKELPDN